MDKIFHVNSTTKEELSADFLSNLSVTIECNKLTSEEENYHNIILKTILADISKEHIFEYVSYIYREIINNAKKANLKRLYFKTKNLDITNAEQYKKGMINFKYDLVTNSDHYMNLLEDEKYYIRSTFKIIDDKFYINVSNNANLTEEEISIIHKKIDEAHEFTNIEDAMMTVDTNKEGAGLGLIISVLILKKLALSSDNLRITSNNVETSSILTIPLSVTTLESRNLIKESLLNEIDDIPQFPEHIANIQEMLTHDDVDIMKLSIIIVKDPALSGRIIKFSNSALFLTYKEISVVSDAIKVIGLYGLKSIIYTYGSDSILQNRYPKKIIKEISDHSHNVAEMAFLLARNKLPRNQLESLYIAGLLHDLGKIMLTAIDTKVMASINNLCHKKNISLKVVEELTNGFNHRIIGGLLARKWNFPNLLIDVIENHHSPELGELSNQPILYYVYLANIMVHSNNDCQVIYEKLSNESRAFLKIKDISDIKKFQDLL